MAVANEELDPELAALLDLKFVSHTAQSSSETPVDMKGAAPVSQNGADMEDVNNDGNAHEVDLTVKSFPEITKQFEDEPSKLFDEPLPFYKKATENTGAGGQRLREVLQKYVSAKDIKDKGVFRQQIIPAFWEMIRTVVRETAGKLPDPKKYLLRYGILHPGFMSPEMKPLFGRIIIENLYDQPIYYLDEWLRAVGRGTIRNSSTDEVKVARANSNNQQRQMLEKTKGRLEGIRSMMQSKTKERRDNERNLKEGVDAILDNMDYKVEGVYACYNQLQRTTFNEIQDLVKDLLKIDREMNVLIKEFEQTEFDVGVMEKRISDTEEEEVEVDVKALDTEYDTVRQMTKMTVGRQGNHFPILTKDYFHCTPNDIGTRENVISILAWLESIDQEAFCRMYRNKLNRIVPYVVLLPNYGDAGVCWEPFDRYNRASSRGRIAIPMYPKNLQVAVLSAIADLRWQVAKEKASYYWMEEGLTGYYYQWFSERKLKGDVKEAFIQDYIVWITKESEGTQRLDKELRGIFWRYMPFTQPIKDKLKTRSFAYQELYQRDLNRAMSDGY